MKKVLNVEEADIIKQVSEFKNPCDKCWMKNNGCCGCPDRGVYEKLINPIKDAGLIEILHLMQQYKELNKKLAKIKNELQECEKEINLYIVMDKNEENVLKDYLFK